MTKTTKTGSRIVDAIAANPPSVTLKFVGPAIDGVPATDLERADIARIAFVRRSPELRPFETADIPEDEVSAVADELAKTGSYSLPGTPASPED